MKKLATLTLQTAGGNDTLKRGTIDIRPGKWLRGVYLKVTANLANASGGSVTLSDTQRQSFLSGYRCTMSYGRGQRRKPFNSILFTRLQRISRFLVGQDWEGYSNSTNGLARALPNSATTATTLWVYVPLASYIWNNQKARRVLGVGRTQAKTIQIELLRETDTLPSGVTVSGSVSIAVYPHLEDSTYDAWMYLAEWKETDVTDNVARLPKGLAIYGAEDSAALTSSALTNVELRIGEEVMYSGISPNDAYTPVLQLTNIPSEADVSDRETTLYQWTQERDFAELKPGQLTLEQITKDLGTAKLRGLVFPIPDEQEVREDVEDAAGKQGRNQPLKAVNAAVVQDMNIPESHHAFTGMYLFDASQAEFTRYPGLLSTGDGDRAEPYIPLSVTQQAQGLIAEYLAKNELANAESVVRRVALAVPGAVQDEKGFALRGSPILDQVRAALR